MREERAADTLDMNFSLARAIDNFFETSAFFSIDIDLGKAKLAETRTRTHMEHPTGKPVLPKHPLTNCMTCPVRNLA